MRKSKLKKKFISKLEKNKGIIYKIGNSYCGDSEARKDLIQEIILQLWKSYDKYDENFKWSTWMYRIALNTAISYLRKEKLRSDTSAELDEDFLYFDEGSDFSEQSEEVVLLYEFIGKLKSIDKAIMMLYLEEKSYKEIAEILGISKTNVSTKINRIKEKLRKQFSDER